MWPLERWTNRFGLSASTRRSAMLGGRYRATETTLGDLRRFVARLEDWPERARVKPESGAVLSVAYTEDADPLVRPESGNSGIGDTDEQ